MGSDGPMMRVHATRRRWLRMRRHDYQSLTSLLFRSIVGTDRAELRAKATTATKRQRQRKEKSKSRTANTLSTKHAIRESFCLSSGFHRQYLRTTRAERQDSTRRTTELSTAQVESRESVERKRLFLTRRCDRWWLWWCTAADCVGVRVRSGSGKGKTGEKGRQQRGQKSQDEEKGTKQLKSRGIRRAVRKDERGAMVEGRGRQTGDAGETEREKQRERKGEGRESEMVGEDGERAERR